MKKKRRYPERIAAVTGRQYTESSPEKSEEEYEVNGGDSGAQDPEYNQAGEDEEFKVVDSVRIMARGRTKVETVTARCTMSVSTQEVRRPPHKPWAGDEAAREEPAGNPGSTAKTLR